MPGEDISPVAPSQFSGDLWTPEGRKASRTSYRQSALFKEKRAERRQEERAREGPAERLAASVELSTEAVFAIS
jgi:hypothetical protein